MATITDATKPMDYRGILSLGQLISTFLFMGPIMVLIFLYLLVYTSWWPLPLIYGIYYVLDRSSCQLGGRQNDWVRNWAVWKWAAEYFPVKLIKTEELDRDKNYLIGYHPHGIMNIGGFVNFAVNGTDADRIFHGFKKYLTVLQGHFDFPIYRDYVMSSGLVSVAKNSVRYLLDGPRRRASIVVVIMGGAHEALDAHPGTNKVHVLSKWGFFKMALETGTSVIPCYSFGENNIFNQVENKRGSSLRKIQNFLTRIMGLSPPIFYGEYGIIPLKRPITTIVGAPIEVGKLENPTDEDIANLRNQYVEKLKELFYRYKDRFGKDEDDIEVI